MNVLLPLEIANPKAAQRFFCDAIRRTWTELRHEGGAATGTRTLASPLLCRFLPAAPISPLDFPPAIWYPLHQSQGSGSAKEDLLPPNW
jgi:hypothetical protein